MVDNILSLRPNRALLIRQLGAYINLAHEREEQLALLIMRVQRGSELVALHGHHKIETLIEEMATRMNGICRSSDRIVRVGDFEVAIVLQQALNEGHAVLAANKLLRSLAVPFNFEDTTIIPMVCIGIATFPDHAGKPESLVQYAESALAVAEAKKQAYSLYSASALDDTINSWELENEINDASRNGEFEVHYQPKISLHSGLLAGAEALLRWNSPKRGMVPPEVFIPIATRSGRLPDMTWAALNLALEHASSWPMRFGPLSVAVNVSPALLEDGGLVDRVADAMGLWGTKPSRLILEITESAVMRHPEASFETIRELRDKGVAVSIDDFGTGYSSLANFRNIPATELKIDRSFVIDMLENDTDTKIVQTIIGLAKAFDLGVAAEGAEDLATVNALAAMGCDQVQGYGISPALSGPAFVQFINNFVPPVMERTPRPGEKPGSLRQRKQAVAGFPRH